MTPDQIRARKRAAQKKYQKNRKRKKELAIRGLKQRLRLLQKVLADAAERYAELGDGRSRTTLRRDVTLEASAFLLDVSEACGVVDEARISAAIAQLGHPYDTPATKLKIPELSKLCALYLKICANPSRKKHQKRNSGNANAGATIELLGEFQYANYQPAESHRETRHTQKEYKNG